MLLAPEASSYVGGSVRNPRDPTRTAGGSSGGGAAAVATAHGWKELVTPGIMCGVLGYVIATFIGVALSGFLGGLS